MLKDFFKISLQMFGEGGDGGSAGGNAGTSATGDSGQSADSTVAEARIPERAKKYHAEAVKLEAEKRGRYPEATKDAESVKAKSNSDTGEKKSETGYKKLSYKELIKSPEYADDHKRYMEDTLSKRLSKYSDTEAKYAKAMETLGFVANKYGLDPNSETFVADIDAKIKEDDDFFADYAAKHNIPVEEARANAVMQAKLARYEREAAARKTADENARHIAILRANGERTKTIYPEFNIDVEMENEKFRKICVATGGDTTTAYRIAHWDEIYTRGRAEAVEETKRALSQSIQSGQSRPAENGLNAQSPVHTPAPDFSGMDSKQLREYYFTHLRGKH